MSKTPPPQPSIADVAQRAGVSTATVSRVLNAPELVRAKTRQLVESAIETLGYTPHFGARALASNRTGTVGAIIPTMENAIFARGLQALQEELAAAGVTLLVSTSNYDAAQEERQIRTLLSRSVDGLVLIGEARSPEIYDLLEQRAVPFVLMWSWREDCPWSNVGFDNYAAASEVAERVFGFGHRRIAMIAGVTAGNDRALARVEGVRDALAARGAALAPSRLIEAEYSIEAGMAATQALMEMDEPPTAIICGNDVLAAGAMMGARARGLCVSEQLSITGFDDIDISQLLDPPLATVHIPHRRMGRAGAQLLLSMLETPSNLERVRIDAEFIERASLGPAPQNRP